MLNKEKNKKKNRPYEKQKKKPAKRNNLNKELCDIFSNIFCPKSRKIEQEKEALQAIYNSLPDGVYTTDIDRRILSFNPGGEAITGFKKQDIIGKRCKDIFAHEDEKGNLLCQFNCPLDIAMKDGKTITPRKVFLKTSAGRRVPVVLSAAPIKDKSGRVVGSAEFFRDITNEIKIEQLKSDFLSVVSHELRIPLAAIKESISLVIEGICGATTDTQQSLLTSSKNEIDRLNRMVSELLDISRIEAGRLKIKRSRLDLSEVVKALELSYHPIAEKKSIAISVEVEQQLPFAIADSDRVRQVFSNLLSNAFKFTSAGGSVKIGCAKKSENLIECFVSDTGCGIPSDLTAKLFGRFEQLGIEEDKRRGGAGLGLYISKTIVDALGGTIWAESEEGKGSKFSFTLPIYQKGMEFYLGLNTSIKEARDAKVNLALLMLEVDLSDTETDNLMHIIEHIIRGPNDRVAKDGNNIYIMLFEASKDGAASVKDRIQAQVEKSEFGHRKVITSYGIAVYPDEAVIDEELIKAVKKNAANF